MNEDEITAYLQQFSLPQLEQIKQQVAQLAVQKAMQKAKLEAERKAQEIKDKQKKQVRATVGMPPSPPKDLAALADATNLDISGLMRDIDRRKR